MTEVVTPLADDDLRKPKIPCLPFKTCLPPIHPAIWPCQVCFLIRICLYDYRPGVTLPAQPVGCGQCGDAIVRYVPEVMR